MFSVWERQCPVGTVLGLPLNYMIFMYISWPVTSSFSRKLIISKDLPIGHFKWAKSQTTPGGYMDPEECNRKQIGPGFMNFLAEFQCGFL